MYKLNKNVFKAHSAEQAVDHASYYRKLTWQERLKITIYLNSIAFRLVGKPEPRLDRTAFSVRARD